MRPCLSEARRRWKWPSGLAEARRIVVQQRERMASLKADGHSTVDHEKTLEVLETTLRIFEHDERSIRERMGIPK
jgi:hypothetical protein